MKTPITLTVSQLNAYLKSVIEFDENLRDLYLKGEISNFTNHYRTGHLYMTLKDGDSAVKAVMFRSAAQKLRFKPENSMSVIVRGRVSVYERDGQYQFYIEEMQPDGFGALALAFEQLKSKLEKEGLFDSKYKKPIPKFPKKIGVATSPTGAAVQDILKILNRRYPLAEVIFSPVQVQGESAAGQIASAIYEFNRKNCVDVLIVGRGGGSIEDLWAFNEEVVARAIFASQIPVISAVGHETDFTISDFVADLRAATPSAAAELATPDIESLFSLLDVYKFKLDRLITATIENKKNKLEYLKQSGALTSAEDFMDSYKLNLDSLIMRVDDAMNRHIADKLNTLHQLTSKLDAINPAKVLSRGYAIALNNGKTLTKISEVAENDKIDIVLTDGTLNCTVNGKAANNETDF